MAAAEPQADPAAHDAPPSLLVEWEDGPGPPARVSGYRAPTYGTSAAPPNEGRPARGLLSRTPGGPGGPGAPGSNSNGPPAAIPFPTAVQLFLPGAAVAAYAARRMRRR